MKTALALVLALLASACGGGGYATGVDSTPHVATISLATTTASIAVGEQLAINATVRDQFGTEMGVVFATFTSSNASIASVDQTGLVRGVGLGGPVTITVTSHGISAAAAITVTVAGVAISPSIGSLPIGQTAQLTAQGVDWFNNPLSAGAAVWSSSNSAVASANAATGLVTGLTAGTTTIMATLGGKSSSFALSVGVPSANDGKWSGISGTTTLIIDITFGKVSHFNIPSVAVPAGLVCSGGTLNEALSTPVVNNQFTATLATSATTLNGTITSATAMQLTHNGINVALSCSNPAFPGTPSVPSTYVVVATTTPINMTKQ